MLNSVFLLANFILASMLYYHIIRWNVPNSVINILKSCFEFSINRQKFNQNDTETIRSITFLELINKKLKYIFFFIWSQLLI